MPSSDPLLPDDIRESYGKLLISKLPVEESVSGQQSGSCPRERYADQARYVQVTSRTTEDSR